MVSFLDDGMGLFRPDLELVWFGDFFFLTQVPFRGIAQVDVWR